MLIFALGLFAIAALAGAYIAIRVFKNAMPPWPMAILHGLFDATGIALLLYLMFLAGTPQPQVVTNATGLLLAAAVVGFALLSFHLRMQMAPKLLVGVHAILATSGFLTLAVAAYE
jgi:hypothetical protein